MTPESLNLIFEVKLTEAMTLPVAETEEHTVSDLALPKILEFLQGKQAFAFGPGLSLHPRTRELVRSIVLKAPCPLVLDADALTILSDTTDLLRQCPESLVLTPHPGEMARLTHGSIKDVQDDRIGTAVRFSKENNVVLVLKGFRTIIAAPDGRLAINSTGNPAMASGGMGDALTGMIAGLLAQGFEPFQAAALSVFSHGAAGDRALGGVASRGLTASDLLDEVPGVIGHLENFKGRP
jgi:NAD(P)H-hydrate epimerase